MDGVRFSWLTRCMHLRGPFAIENTICNWQRQWDIEYIFRSVQVNYEGKKLLIAQSFNHKDIPIRWTCTPLLQSHCNQYGIYLKTLFKTITKFLRWHNNHWIKTCCKDFESLHTKPDRCRSMHLHWHNCDPAHTHTHILDFIIISSSYK